MKKVFYAVICFVILILVFELFGNKSSMRIYSGICIAGVNVGGMIQSDVASILKLWQQDYKQKEININYNGTAFKITAENIDLKIDEEATLHAAYDYGRTGSAFIRIKNILRAFYEGYNVPIYINYNENKLLLCLEQIQEIVEKPVLNASFSLEEDKIIAEQQGIKLDVSKLKPMLVNSFENPYMSTIALPVIAINPAVTKTQIEKSGLNKILAVYSTSFNDKDVNRSHNIRLAASKINGYVMQPNTNFSFNSVVGPREKMFGFKEALEIINGEFVPGIGGGICQVSSTLYNAVLLSNLKIIERHNHAKPLAYIPLGRDATVFYDSLDFQFTNNLDQPIMIMAEVKGNKLSVGIVGNRRLEYDVKVVTDNKKTIPPVVVRREDKNMLLGESEIEKNGNPGYELYVWRIIFRDGQEIERHIISKDRYMPDKTIIRVGTKMPDFVENSLGTEEKQK